MINKTFISNKLDEMGYTDWHKFEGVIKKATEACKSIGFEASNHFCQTAKLVSIGRAGGGHDI